jgi:hypothetical protein
MYVMEILFYIICVIFTKAILLAVLMLMTHAYNMGVAYPISHPALTQPHSIQQQICQHACMCRIWAWAQKRKWRWVIKNSPPLTWFLKNVVTQMDFEIACKLNLLAASPWTPQHAPHGMPNSLQLDVHELLQLNSWGSRNQESQLLSLEKSRECSLRSWKSDLGSLDLCLELDLAFLLIQLSTRIPSLTPKKCCHVGIHVVLGTWDLGLHL